MLRLPAILISPRTRGRTALLGVFAGAVPVFGGLAISVVTPSFSRPMFSETPALLGIPHGTIIVVFALLWGALGGYVVGTSRSPWVLPLVLFVFTLPAVIAIILGPAIVLILQNFGS